MVDIKMEGIVAMIQSDSYGYKLQVSLPYSVSNPCLSTVNYSSVSIFRLETRYDTVLTYNNLLAVE
jgi:hypothetical protein